MATRITFGAGAEGKLHVDVDEDFVAVAHALEEGNWVTFTAGGKEVFVNARLVLWVQEAPSGRAAGFN